MDRLEEIIERLNKVTKGEWHYNNSSCVLTMGQLNDMEMGKFKYRVVAPFIQFSMGEICNDFEFLAHSKNDIEYLIDIIKELRHQDKMQLKPKEEMVNEIEICRGKIETINMQMQNEEDEHKIQNFYRQENELRTRINTLYWILGIE